MALELLDTGVPGPRPQCVGSCLPRYGRSAGATARRDFRDHRVSDSCTALGRSQGGQEEGGCVHPDEVRDGGALLFRGSAGTQT